MRDALVAIQEKHKEVQADPRYHPSGIGNDPRGHFIRAAWAEAAKIASDGLASGSSH